MNALLFNLFIRFFSVTYILFSIITLSNCTDDRSGDSVLDQIKSRQADSVRLLTDRFDAERFACDNPMSSVNKSVILDTTILGVQKRDGNYFIKAEIKTDCNQKYFTELKCSGKIIEAFHRTKSNDALIVARVESITVSEYITETDSLSNRSPIINAGKIFLLHGECLALIENTYTTKAN